MIHHNILLDYHKYQQQIEIIKLFKKKNLYLIFINMLFKKIY